MSATVVRPAADWLDRAACRGVDLSVFYPTTQPKWMSERAVAPAARVCAACPVRGQCLDEAVARAEQHGVWAGTTPAERRAGLAYTCAQCGVASPRPVCRCCKPSEEVPPRKEEDVPVRFVAKVPPPAPSRHRHRETGRQLRQHPGQWAEVASGVGRGKARRLASDIRCGSHYSAYRPRGAFQAETRRADNGGYAVYARYVGPTKTGR